MSDATFRLVELAVQLVFGVLAAYVIPVIVRMVKQYLAQSEVGKAVLAAQQTLWEKSGEERKSFAMTVAREALDALHISMSDDQLSTLIEAAVYEMKQDSGDGISCKEASNG